MESLSCKNDFLHYADDHTQVSDLYLSDRLSIPLLSPVLSAQKSFVFPEMKGTKATIEKYDRLSERVSERASNLDGGEESGTERLCVFVCVVAVFDGL